MRGYFAVGVYGCKTSANVGTLWRSAYNMGAAYIFTIGRRFPRQASDTVKAWKHVPMLEFTLFDEFLVSRPHDCLLVGVEQCERSRNLPEFSHPERAIYVLGAEDSGLPREVIERCNHVVSIDTAECLNVAVAGSIVMYDRRCKAS